MNANGSGAGVTAAKRRGAGGQAQTTEKKGQRRKSSSAMNQGSTLPMTHHTFYSAKYTQRAAERHERRFAELTEMLMTPDYEEFTENTSSKSGAKLSSSNDVFPTLQIGYLARAMGLNVSNKDVVYITKLAEDDVPSLGFVNRARLQRILVDALVTGVLGGDTLLVDSLIPASRLAHQKPTCCQRESAARILQAFKTLDTANRGYLGESQLKKVLSTMGEPMSDAELEEMMLTYLDPEAGVINYSELVSLLAND